VSGGANWDLQQRFSTILHRFDWYLTPARKLSHCSLDDLALCEELHERLQGARLEQRPIGIAMDDLLFIFHLHRFEDLGRLTIRGLHL
jgi:hypothetical protein